MQARAAQAVDIEGGRFHGDTSPNRRHSGQIGIPRFGWNDIAHDHMTDLLAVDTCVCEGAFDGGGSQISQGRIFQGSAETADGSPCGTNKVNICLGHKRLHF
ncbi:hypothetical protein D3C73_1496180 [compost metagenome]